MNNANEIAQLTRTVEKLERQVQKLSHQGERNREVKKTFSGPVKRPETRTCYNCGIQGHLAANCRKPKKPRHSGNEEGRLSKQ